MRLAVMVANIVTERLPTGLSKAVAPASIHGEILTTDQAASMLTTHPEIQKAESKHSLKARPIIVGATLRNAWVGLYFSGGKPPAETKPLSRVSALRVTIPGATASQRFCELYHRALNLWGQ